MQSTSSVSRETLTGGKPVTMKDVAELAQVSMASVSRVMNNDPTVRPHIRQAVEEAIRTLNYELKPHGNGKQTQLRRIGLVIPDITHAYFPLLIKGITNIAKVQGSELILCNSNNDPETEHSYVQRLVGSGIDGIIYIPFAEKMDLTIESLIEDKFPIVFLDREFNLPNICSVTSDNEEGAYQATSYLASLGHRDIIFISGPQYFSTSVSRRAGFKRGLTEVGIEDAEERIVCGDTTMESGYQETVKLLQSKTPFSAIFASNDLMAFGVLKALDDNGLRVPDDVSVVGYDDIPFASYINLTTIAQPSYEIGRNALMLLVDLINDLREPPQKIILRDSLIIRKSCKRA